jgi:glycylpeptide N-tetradecanoyltransferase
LVAFLSLIPITLRINQDLLPSVGSNFLCCHEKLRGKNLIPLLLDEMKRRLIRNGIQHGIATVVRLIAEPLTTAGYRHRMINIEKLAAIGFAPIPPEVSVAQLAKKYAVPKAIRLPGFRAMQPEDVGEVTVKLNAYLQKFKVAQVFSEAQAGHFFLPRPGILASYVVKSGDGIDGFFSFYVVTAIVNGVPQYPTLTIAYVYYYFAKPSLLIDLARAAIQAVHWEYGADVVNALDIQDNGEFRENLNFTKGSGAVNYFLYNYAIPPIRPTEIAVVLP